MHIRFASVAFICGLSLAACDQMQAIGNSNSVPPASAHPGTTQKLSVLEDRVAKAEEKISTIELDSYMAGARLDKIEGGGAELNTEPGYALLHNPFGPFPVTYDRAVPYLDGHKVFISIGNPTNITFSGAKIEVEYGAAVPKTEDGKIDWRRMDQYRKARKIRLVDVTKDFQPGWYTQIEVTITPSKPEEMREIEVKAQFNELRMGRRAGN